MSGIEAATAACERAAPAARRETVSLEPASAYEAVTRQMVIGVGEELREIKARLNGLLFMVAGSLLLDVALRLADRGS
jgi:hypothetical protein